MGRPNVGKSALFNRMAGSKMAVVFDQPGITRDRMYTRTEWNKTEFVLIDTGADGRVGCRYLQRVLEGRDQTGMLFSVTERRPACALFHISLRPVS